MMLTWYNGSYKIQVQTVWALVSRHIYMEPGMGQGCVAQVFFFFFFFVVVVFFLFFFLFFLTWKGKQMLKKN